MKKIKLSDHKIDIEQYIEGEFKIMYIMIIARGYPSEKYKMNGIFEYDQAKALAATGHKIVYLSLDARSIRRKRRFGYSSIRKDKIDIEALDIPCGNLPKNLFNKIVVYSLKKLIDKAISLHGKPDIIHSHFIEYGYFSKQALNDLKIPLVLTEHSSKMNQEKISPYLLEIGSYTYPKMNKIITVSNHLSNNLKENFLIDSIVIPNIVDTNEFVYKVNNKETEDFCFISTGSLLENKRMELLIESFYVAFNGQQNIKLYIYGDGPEKSKLVDLVRYYNLSGIVFLMGLVERKEIAKKMSQSDCFVLLSKLETFGVAYIEALSMGLPVISTKNGGPEDFINNKNGIIITNDSVACIANNLKKVYDNIDLYNNKLISTNAVELFSPEKIAQQILSVYHEVLSINT